MKIELHRIPILLGHSFLRNLALEKLVVVNYHMVSDQDLPYVNSLYRYPTVSEFSSHIQYYKRNYNIIHLHDLLDHVQLGKALPKNALMITFDDGFREIYENVAPILLEEKVASSFFICPSFLNNRQINHDNKQSLLAQLLSSPEFDRYRLELTAFLRNRQIKGDELKESILNIPYRQRSLIDDIAGIAQVDLDTYFMDYQPYLNNSQLQELVDNGFTIGGHSMDHARFAELDLHEQLGQALDSVNQIREQFKISYGAFAFPYTDIGIGSTFYENVTGELDLIFGTQGLMDDPLPFSFQRINAEKYGYSAKRNLKYQYAKKVIKRRLGRNQIIRS